MEQEFVIVVCYFRIKVIFEENRFVSELVQVSIRTGLSLVHTGQCIQCLIYCFIMRLNCWVIAFIEKLVI